jgi:hypothetical protein
MPDTEDNSASIEAAEPCPRACLLCHREFMPAKPNQAYHSSACRRRALRLRQRADELSEERGQPRLNANRLWHGQQALRLRANLPALRKSGFLHARAEVLEAEYQLKRWGRLFQERTARISKLEPPPFGAKPFILEPGEALPFDPEMTHGAIVSTDGSLAVALLGRELAG